VHRARSRSPASWSFVTGGVLIVVGLAVPTRVWIDGLTSPATPQLLQGALLFRAGLLALGIFIIFVARFMTPVAAPDSPDHRPSQQSLPPALGAILAAALALRLYGLNSGFWHDEILTLVNYARLPFGAIVTTYGDQNQHILYSILAHGSIEAFGESNWALRLPAALFGVAGIWALYALGALVADRREALFAAAFLAASYHHIWFSQNARGYTGLLFWALLSSWLLLRGIRASTSSIWVAFAAATALGVYTHLTMLFVVAGQFSVFAAEWYRRRGDVWPGRWPGLLVGFGLAGMLSFQLHALMLPQILLRAATEGSVVATWMNPLWTIAEIARSFQFGAAGLVVGVAAAVVMGIGARSYARSEPAILQLLIIPPALCAAVMIGLGHHLWPRLFFFSAGFGVLVVVRGTVEAGRFLAPAVGWPASRAPAVGGTLCTLLILASLVSAPRAYLPKQDYAGALGFIEEQRRAGDVVIAVGLAAIPAKELYGMDWEYVDSAAALEAARSPDGRTWLLYTFPVQAFELYPDVMRIVERDFEIVGEFPGTVGDGTIVVCRTVEQ